MSKGKKTEAKERKEGGKQMVRDIRLTPLVSIQLLHIFKWESSMPLFTAAGFHRKYPEDTFCHKRVSIPAWRWSPVACTISK